ncbi:hypothetical protein AGMMS50212_15820 [Spirochaetia bacterium]|nr:hypothetical protein AGMMS50212_15820 [Spirochaetia bacterium]
MTSEQEDALYHFLDERIEPFTLKDAAMASMSKDYRKFGRLQNIIAGILSIRRLAFPMPDGFWLSRNGCFLKCRFVISPSRLELLNGILIPGHRCIPFANPFVLTQDYKFFYEGSEIKMSVSEGSPEEFYPFFSLYGEEYAPQCIARESPENEIAFNSELDEDPVEVSVNTLDMRSIYREASFVPGDRFLVTVKDWKNCCFDLERVEKGAWKKSDLDEWLKAAEEGFKKSFDAIGAGMSTEEQIAWAFFFGGSRMRDVPAYSLEDFLYDKTDKIDVTNFGLESRFWSAGKEIPDYKQLEGIKTQTDETPIERLLFQNNIPISEYVIQAYVRDALFRNDTDIKHIVERIVPPSTGASIWHLNFVADYVVSALKDYENIYSVFTDQKTGPLRQQVAELHTAVINLSSRLKKSGIDYSILPKHTFIILSQIQIYSSGILEELDMDEEPSEIELDAIDSSMENMIDIFDEIKELIDKSRENFRNNNITLVRPEEKSSHIRRTVQVSLGGTDIWRRIIVPLNCRLCDMHLIVQAVFSWKEKSGHSWVLEYMLDDSLIDSTGAVKENITLADLNSRCINEINYEYGRYWTVKLIISPCNDMTIKDIQCIAGSSAAPPEQVEGPLRLRRFILALERTDEKEKASAVEVLGKNFEPDKFDINECNKNIKSIIYKLTIHSQR